MTDTTAYWRPDLSIDQTLALKTAATRLAAEFDGTYGMDVSDVRPIRDELERHVRRLLDDLHVPA
ncbi:hypothetical protein ACWKSP_08465 [Micromonosporaceae bacterium Da 78-11]